MEQTELQATIEAILFASGEPVGIARLAEMLEVEPESIEQSAEELGSVWQYERRGVRLVRLERSLQMISAPEYGDIIRRTLEERKPLPMSKAALETLALVAYYQPTTKAYIEKIRGVESGNTVNTLCEKGLLTEAGRMDVPGRPILYRTTPAFLRAFGLSSLSELPDLSDLDEVDGQLRLTEPTDSPNDTPPVAAPEPLLPKGTSAEDAP